MATELTLIKPLACAKHCTLPGVHWDSVKA